MSCEFNSGEPDHCVACDKRGAHEPACVDCTAMEQLLIDLNAMLSKGTAAMARRKVACSREQQGEAEEARQRVLNQIWRDEETLGEEIAGMEGIEADLRFYRGHLARKHAEAEFDADEMADLGEGEAIVISDWKMKILSAFHRENQKKWFGKRGTSCIGFMVITNSDTAGQKNAMFFFLFTDDGCQDDWSVATAKMIMYSQLMPQYFPSVHTSRYRSDGAGCFSSNLARMLQIMWHVWTDIKEVSCRVSISGGGKSQLDGRFAFLNMAADRGVNGGASHWNASTTMDAVLAGGALHASVCGVWLPVRPAETPKVLTKGMQAFHHSELVCAGSRVVGLRVFIASGYGVGRVLKYVTGNVASAPVLPQPYATVIDLTQTQGDLTKAFKSAAITPGIAQQLYEYERVMRPGAHGKQRLKIEAMLLQAAGEQLARS